MGDDGGKFIPLEIAIFIGLIVTPVFVVIGVLKWVYNHVSIH